VTQRRTETILLAAILLLAAGLRLYGLGRESLWFDEAASVRIVRQDFATMFASIKDDERIPPLHYLILHAWVRVLGHAEWSVRLPSALAGIGAVWVLHALTKRLFGVAPALVAALLLAVAPFQIQYSQEARSYSLMLLLSLASCLLFVRLLDTEKPKPSLDASYILASAAALYSHLYALFTLIAQGIAYTAAWLSADKPLLGFRRWVVTQIGVIALFLWWLPTTVRWARSVGSGFWVEPMTVRDLFTTYATYAGGTGAVMFLLALAAIGVIAQRHSLRGVTLMLSLATLPVVVPIVVSILTKPTFTPRYGIVAPAALYALAGCGVAALGNRIVQVVVALSLAGLSVQGLRAIPDKPDWRGTVAHVETVVRPGDYIAMTPRRSTYIYDNYATRRDVTRKGFDSGAIPLSVPLEPGVTVWFIYEAGSYDPSDVLQRGGWYVRSRHERKYLTVLELDDDGPPPVTTAPAATTPPRSSTR
jgi:4-amino-4-deoxy-L-arabinose transferase-like glycosyltransferase